MAKKKTDDDITEMLGSDSAGFKKIEVWPTGVPFIDYMTGIGGFPKGRIIEVHGKESSGKSTILLRAMAAAQRQGYGSVYMDYEGSFDPEWARQMGLDVDDTKTFGVVEPETCEKGFNLIINKLIPNKKIALIVIDSVAMMPTEAENEGGMDKMQVASLAKVLKKGLRLAQAALNKHHSQVTICLINQLYDAIGTGMPGRATPMTTAGGMATKYTPSQRFEFKKVGQITGQVTDTITGERKSEKIGDKVRVKLVKNKVGPPWGEAQFVCIKGRGVDDVYSIVDLAMIRKVIFKTRDTGPKGPNTGPIKKGWFTIPAKYAGTAEDLEIYGEDKMRSVFYNNKDLYKLLEVDIMALLATPAEPVEEDYEDIVDPEEFGATDLSGITDMLGDN
jgi:recombination protein RecA